MSQWLSVLPCFALYILRARLFAVLRLQALVSTGVPLSHFSILRKTRPGTTRPSSFNPIGNSGTHTVYILISLRGPSLAFLSYPKLNKVILPRRSNEGGVGREREAIHIAEASSYIEGKPKPMGLVDRRQRNSAAFWSRLSDRRIRQL